MIFPKGVLETTWPTIVRHWPCARGLTAFAHVEIARNFLHAQRPLNPRDPEGAPARGRFVGDVRD